METVLYRTLWPLVAIVPLLPGVTLRMPQPWVLRFLNHAIDLLYRLSVKLLCTRKFATYTDLIVSFVLRNCCFNVICSRSIYVVIPPCLHSLWVWRGTVSAVITGVKCKCVVFSSWNPLWSVTVELGALIFTMQSNHLTQV